MSANTTDSKETYRRLRFVTVFAWTLAFCYSLLSPQLQAQQIEDTPVWRVQLRVTTSNVSGGPVFGNPGTTDFVDVKLNSSNTTRLYSSFNNSQHFAAGTSHGYDLVLDHVARLRDITMLQISKLEASTFQPHIPANDWWGIQSLTLSVNGRAVYDITFPSPYWMSTNVVIPYPSLRSHPLWLSYTLQPLPQLISGGELITRIDGIVGDFIGGPALRSGEYPEPLWWELNGTSYAVILTGSGPNTIRVELFFKYWPIVLLWPIVVWNPVEHVDVSLDLDFSCGNGKLFVATRNLDVSSFVARDNTTQINKALLSVLLQTSLPLKIQSAFQSVTYKNQQGQAACPPVRVVGNSVYLF